MSAPRPWLPRSRAVLDPTQEVVLRWGLHRREPAALEAVFRLYWPTLLAQARWILPEDLDPEDAAGEVMLCVVRKASTFDPRMPIFPWLARICVNVCTRRRSRDERRPAPEATRALRPLAPTDEAGARDRERVLVRALKGLSARCREVVALRYLFDLTTTEVAELLGVDVTTVTKTLYRGLRALRTGPQADALREWLDGWGEWL